MQTFLPWPDFAKSAAALDTKRLLNQLYREGMTLARGKWQNHPASILWRGYQYNLCEYLLACAAELRKRGYDYTRYEDELRTLQGPPTVCDWLGYSYLHASHRANLRRKDPVHYAFAEEPSNVYVWRALDGTWYYQAVHHRRRVP